MKNTDKLAKNSDTTQLEDQADDPYGHEAKPPLDYAKEAFEEGRYRRQIGIAFAIVGLIAIVGTIVFAIYGLVDLVTKAAGISLYVFIGLLVAHSVVSVAIVWFAYQALRAAERMFVPRRLMGDAKNVDVIRALVGIDAPTTAATKQIEEASKPLLEVVKAFAEIVGNVQSGGTKKE